MTPSLLTHITTALLVAVAQANTLYPRDTSSDPDCDGSCAFANHMNDGPKFWGWGEPDASFPYDNIAFITRTATKTVVTIVNTVWGETSVTTVLPPEATTVNEEGTAIQVISYSRPGDEFSSTTTLTFPSFFWLWPETVKWIGTLLTTSDGATATTSECFVAESPSYSTALVTATPTVPMPYPGIVDPGNLNEKDSRGIGYRTVHHGEDGVWNYNALSKHFPDQLAFTSCLPTWPGPHFGGFDETYWETAEETSYVGVETSTLPPPKITPPPKEDAEEEVVNTGAGTALSSTVREITTAVETTTSVDDKGSTVTRVTTVVSTLTQAVGSAGMTTTAASSLGAAALSRRIISSWTGIAFGGVAWLVLQL